MNSSDETIVRRLVHSLWAQANEGSTHDLAPVVELMGVIDIAR